MKKVSYILRIFTGWSMLYKLVYNDGSVRSIRSDVAFLLLATTDLEECYDYIPLCSHGGVILTTYQESLIDCSIVGSLDCYSFN